MDEAQKQAMAEAVARIRENMTTAAKAAGRDPGEVLLCAACKTRTVEEVRYSADLPIDLFGENHVQELVEKLRDGRDIPGALPAWESLREDYQNTLSEILKQA